LVKRFEHYAAERKEELAREFAHTAARWDDAL
jgi:hypothetical protein